MLGFVPSTVIIYHPLVGVGTLLFPLLLTRPTSTSIQPPHPVCPPATEGSPLVFTPDETLPRWFPAPQETPLLNDTFAEQVLSRVMCLGLWMVKRK